MGIIIMQTIHPHVVVIQRRKNIVISIRRSSSILKYFKNENWNTYFVLKGKMGVSE